MVHRHAYNILPFNSKLMLLLGALQKAQADRIDINPLSMAHMTDS